MRNQSESLQDKRDGVARREHSSSAETASILGQALKNAFPGVRFLVNAESCDDITVVDVDWVNGPSIERVRRITQLFERTAFIFCGREVDASRKTKSAIQSAEKTVVEFMGFNPFTRQHTKSTRNPEIAETLAQSLNSVEGNGAVMYRVEGTSIWAECRTNCPVRMCADGKYSVVLSHEQEE